MSAWRMTDSSTPLTWKYRGSGKWVEIWATHALDVFQEIRAKESLGKKEIHIICFEI